MSRGNNNLYDLLNSLKGMIPAKEENFHEDREWCDCREKDHCKQPWPKPNDKCKTFEIPETKTVVVQNELNCCPEKDSCKDSHKDGGHKTSDPIWDGMEDGAADADFDGAFSSGKKFREREAFAYLYLLSPVPVTVLAGADVPLNFADPVRNIGFVPPQAVIEKAGNYDIYYGLNVTTALVAPAFFALAVNGVPIAKTFVPILTGQTGEFSGNAILTLNRGDVVTIRNTPGSGAIVLSAAPGVGAQLEIILLD